MKANLAQLRARRWMRQMEARLAEEREIETADARWWASKVFVNTPSRPVNAIAGPQTYTPRGVR